MDIDKCKKEARIAIDGEEIERVSSFEYRGARIEANGKSTPEIRRRLAMATTQSTKMISIWKGQCTKTKLRVLETDGRRGRGRPTRRWEQDIHDWMDMTTTQAGRLAEDHILFRQKVQEATSRQEIS